LQVSRRSWPSFTNASRKFAGGNRLFSIQAAQHRLGVTFLPPIPSVPAQARRPDYATYSVVSVQPAKRTSKRPGNSVGFARASRTSRPRRKQAACMNISESSEECGLRRGEVESASNQAASASNNINSISHGKSSSSLAAGVVQRDWEVRFRGQSGNRLVGLSLTGFDPDWTSGSPVSVGVSAALIMMSRRPAGAP